MMSFFFKGAIQFFKESLFQVCTKLFQNILNHFIKYILHSSKYIQIYIYIYLESALITIKVSSQSPLIKLQLFEFQISARTRLYHNIKMEESIWTVLFLIQYFTLHKSSLHILHFIESNSFFVNHIKMFKITLQCKILYVLLIFQCWD